MIKLIVEILGDEKARIALSGLANDIRDWRPLWRDLNEYLSDRIEEQFNTEGGFSGGWAPLNPEYAAWKARRYPGAPILVATGKLKRSYRKGGRGHVFQSTRDKMRWGSSVPYGVFHQQGTQNMPARPILTFDAGDESAILLQANKFIAESIAKRGLG